MADRTMLQFNFNHAHGKVVTAVLGRREGAAGWANVAVVIGQCALVLWVDPDTDEITVELEAEPKANSGWTTIAELSHFVGSELGWCWVGRNYQGYLDMFTLSFSGLEPQVCFVGEAATVSISRISPVG